MFSRLRQFLFAAIALCLMVSCAADDPDAPLTDGVAMEFSVGADARSSRAGTPFITQFAVFCDMRLSYVETPLINMCNTPVTYNQTSGLWEYDVKQYWYPKYEHSFIGFHPMPVLTAADTGTKYSNSQLSFTYTLPSDYKQTADIIVATHRRKYESGASEPVMMRFGHLLTLIDVAPALYDNTLSSEDYINLLKFELTGFKAKANFAVTPATLQTTDRTDDRQLTINGHEGESQLVIEFAEPKRILNDGNNVSILSDYPVMMLPQTFEVDSDAKIVLSYTYSYDSNTVKQLTILLSNQKWEPGKSFTYRFTIDKNGPHFEEANITDWDVLDVGNVDVD